MFTSSPYLTFQFCAFVQSLIVVLILFVRNAAQDSAHDAQPDHYDQENLLRTFIYFFVSLRFTSPNYKTFSLISPNFY